MNAGMKDLPNVMSEFLSMGVPLVEVVRRATVSAADAIHRPELGRLRVGAPADVAVLAVRRGPFSFVDTYKARMDGDVRVECEMSLRAGKLRWEREGRSRARWDTLGDYGSQSDPRWDGTAEDAPPAPR